jgi:predicted amidophosphoribosyltransferase
MYAKTLAELLDDSLPYLPGAVLVTHVPTTTRRRRERGFDHSQLIAKELCKLRNWRFEPLLQRIDQSHQVGSTRLERTANPIEFRVIGEVSKLRVVVLDDVVTTGNTLEKAAHYLRKAGATEVRAIAVAGNRR